VILIFTLDLSTLTLRHIISLPSIEEHQDAVDGIVQPLVKLENRHKVFVIIRMFEDGIVA
jgi:hypothetical protein